MTALEDLKEAEYIIAANYWENFKYEKEMFQCFGGGHHRVKKITDCVKQIQIEWHEIQRKIKELEGEDV